jgi:hypothetical protein
MVAPTLLGPLERACLILLEDEKSSSFRNLCFLRKYSKMVKYKNMILSSATRHHQNTFELIRYKHVFKAKAVPLHTMEAFEGREM